MQITIFRKLQKGLRILDSDVGWWFLDGKWERIRRRKIEQSCVNRVPRVKPLCNVVMRALRRGFCFRGYPIRHLSSERKVVDFGFQQVKAEEKEGMVAEVFSKVASKYDVMNDFMSFGAHRLWKDDLIRSLGYPAARATDAARIPRHLDVAGGTGDVAFRSLNAMVKEYGSSLQDSVKSDSDSERQIVVCDINPEMLAVGRDRVHKQVGANNADFVGFVEGNAEHLPFPDDSFDIYTIAFGLRNVTNKDAAIREAYRVLRKGGMYV